VTCGPERVPWCAAQLACFHQKPNPCRLTEPSPSKPLICALRCPPVSHPHRGDNKRAHQHRRRGATVQVCAPPQPVGMRRAVPTSGQHAACGLALRRAPAAAQVVRGRRLGSSAATRRWGRSRTPVMHTPAATPRSRPPRRPMQCAHRLGRGLPARPSQRTPGCCGAPGRRVSRDRLRPAESRQPVCPLCVSAATGCHACLGERVRDRHRRILQSRGPLRACRRHCVAVR